MQQAIKRLKVKEKDLAAAPQITQTIKLCIKGGKKTALSAMRLAADDPEIRSFLRKYDSIPDGDRVALPWEAVAVAANVNTKHLLGSIQLAVTSYCAMQSRFLAVTHHPSITRARIKYADMASGERDRTQLDIMVGALPSAKGPTFIGKAVFGSGGGPASRNREDDDDEDTPQAPVVYQGGDIEDRIFGTQEMNTDLDNKLLKIRDKRLDR